MSLITTNRVRNEKSPPSSPGVPPPPSMLELFRRSNFPSSFSSAACSHTASASVRPHFPGLEPRKKLASALSWDVHMKRFLFPPFFAVIFSSSFVFCTDWKPFYRTEKWIKGKSQTKIVSPPFYQCVGPVYLPLFRPPSIFVNHSKSQAHLFLPLC